MKLVPLGLAVVGVFLAASTGWSQLMHHSAKGVITGQYLADRWWPDGDGVGQSFRFDLYYEASLRPDVAEEVFASYPNDGEPHNHWRLRMGELDISAPFDAITLWENGGLAVNYFDEQIGELTLNLEFAGPWNVRALPQGRMPPFLFGSLYYARWDNEGIGAGLVLGDVGRVVTQPVSGVTPVPEPATYASGAVVALVAAIGWRATRRRVATTT